MREIPVSRRRLEHDRTRFANFEGAYAELQGRIEAMRRTLDAIGAMSRSQRVQAQLIEGKHNCKLAERALSRAHVAFFG